MGIGCGDRDVPEIGRTPLQRGFQALYGRIAIIVERIGTVGERDVGRIVDRRTRRVARAEEVRTVVGDPVETRQEPVIFLIEARDAEAELSIEQCCFQPDLVRVGLFRTGSDQVGADPNRGRDSPTSRTDGTGRSAAHHAVSPPAAKWRDRLWETFSAIREMRRERRSNRRSPIWRRCFPPCNPELATIPARVPDGSWP